MKQQVVFKPLQEETVSDVKDFNTIEGEEHINIDMNNAKQDRIYNDSVTDSNKSLSIIDLSVRAAEENEKVYDTLKEPIIETLKRDLLSIFGKAKYVLNPYITDEEKKNHLRNWDLWGPLVLTIMLAISLAINVDDKGRLFVEVFTIFWLGGFIVTINAQVIGAKISIFQVLCLLGYCMFPLNLAAFLFKMIIQANAFFKLILVLAACFWACFCSIGFFKTLIVEEKKLLVLYPVVLFYLYISFFVLMNHKIEIPENK